MSSLVMAALKLLPHSGCQFLIPIIDYLPRSYRGKEPPIYVSSKTKYYLARYLPFHWFLCMPCEFQKYLKTEAFKMFMSFFP